MSDLKPCPFCGGEYTQVRYMGGKWQEPSAFSSGYRGECCDCGATTAAYVNEAEAIAVWNTRVERTCDNLANHQGCKEFVCSECGAHYLGFEFAYCPICGAKVVDA